MKKKNFFRHFVETLPAMSLLGMMLLAPMGASAQVTIGSGDLPQATLDVVGTYPTDADKGKAFRLDDGNQAPGKVLTCGENGVGTWQYAALSRIVGTNGGTLTLPFADMGAVSDATFKRTGAYITLPPGKWGVRVNILLSVSVISGALDITANNSAWVRTSFTDSADTEGTQNLGFLTQDAEYHNYFISANVSGPYPYHHMLFGTIIINNTSSADKTYYYVAGGITTKENFTEEEAVIQVRTSASESSIIATLIQQ